MAQSSRSRRPPRPTPPRSALRRLRSFRPPLRRVAVGDGDRARRDESREERGEQVAHGLSPCRSSRCCRTRKRKPSLRIMLLNSCPASPGAMRSPASRRIARHLATAREAHAAAPVRNAEAIAFHFAGADGAEPRTSSAGRGRNSRLPIRRTRSTSFGSPGRRPRRARSRHRSRS